MDIEERAVGWDGFQARRKIALRSTETSQRSKVYSSLSSCISATPSGSNIPDPSSCYKPSTPAGVAYSSIFIHHGFHPRLFKLKPFGLVSAILKFLCSTFRAATKSCPCIPSSPDPINREYQTLHALRLSLRDRSPHLIFQPSHLLLFVLHS